MISGSLADYENVRMLGGQRAVVRNGYLPSRDVLTAAGDVEVRVPKVRDPSGAGVKFKQPRLLPHHGEPVRCAGQAGIGWPLAQEVAETALEARLCPLAPPSRQARPEADWAAVHAQLRHNGFSLDLLRQEYKAQHPEGYHIGRDLQTRPELGRPQRRLKV